MLARARPTAYNAYANDEGLECQYKADDRHNYGSHTLRVRSQNSTFSEGTSLELPSVIFEPSSLLPDGHRHATKWSDLGLGEVCRPSHKLRERLRSGGEGLIRVPEESTFVSRVVVTISVCDEVTEGARAAQEVLRSGSMMNWGRWRNQIPRVIYGPQIHALNFNLTRFLVCAKSLRCIEALVLRRDVNLRRRRSALRTAGANFSITSSGVFSRAPGTD